MANMAACAALVSVRALLALLLLTRGVWSATFTITNNCGYMVWPGLLSSAGTAPLAMTGFSLAPGASETVEAPSSWSGRMWARTLCAADATGKFSCGTGDCGSGAVQCNGGNAAPPATLAEFTLDGSGGMDFFDVSLVDGYNLPVLVAPQGVSGAEGKCMATGCLVDLNDACPADLKVAAAGAGAVACRSACEAFGSPQYCCTGAYGNPSTCPPSAYSEFFKNACPRAYSYAYDDSTSTFTCAAGTNYAVTFCPATTPTSVKSLGANPQAAGGLPLINDTMVYLGGGGGGDTAGQASGTAASLAAHSTKLVAAVAVALWALL